MARLASSLIVLGLVASARADVTEPDFSEATVTTIPGNPQVTSMAWAPDGSNRLFVTGKDGEIWIVQNGAVLPALFYKFVTRDEATTGELVTSSECGLLSIAFDPAFMDNGYVYVFATLYLPPNDKIEQHIIRFTAVGNTATARTPIITGLPSTGANHDGGAMAFGPDGLLYWAVGNNGSSVGQGTDLMSPGSKMGRASPVPGAAPPPGPYNDGAGPNYDYIFARGLRNPFTMAFHPITGKPWVNIVGDGWEQIFVLAAGDHSGYPQENVEPGTGNATVSPVIAYPTQDPAAITIGATGAVRAGNVVTVTTSSAHRLRKGTQITVASMTNTAFNGTYHITSVPSTTTFTYQTATSGAATTGNGTVTQDDYGNVVLGGTFYDATQFPAAYRQNFFFGDFGQGTYVRVQTDPDGSVSRVTRFGDSAGSHADMSTGPDGALWQIDHGGAIHRITYDAASVGLVVSPQNLRINERSRGVVGVRLSMMPAADVTVTLTRASGSSDVTLSGGPLTFTTANWQTPQFVQVSGAFDNDLAEDVAQLDVTAPTLTTESVTVRVTDTGDTLPPDPPDAGVPDDGGAGQPDGAGPGLDSASGDCSCRVGGSSGGWLFALLAAAVVLIIRARSRAPRSPRD